MTTNKAEWLMEMIEEMMGRNIHDEAEFHRIRKVYHTAILAKLREMVLDEREACAKVAENHRLIQGYEIAKAIRQRGEQ